MSNHPIGAGADRPRLPQSGDQTGHGDRARQDPARVVEHELAVLARRARRITGERARAVHPRLRPAPLLVLARLVELGPMRVLALTTTLDMDRTVLSRAVANLESLGLVERESDPSDGRASFIAATPSARDRVEHVTSQWREWFDDFLDDWSPEQIGDLARTLRRYNLAMQATPADSGLGHHPSD